MTDLTAANLTTQSPVLSSTPTFSVEDVAGTLAATEAQDRASLSGLPSSFGVLAATEALDTAAFPGSIHPAGPLSATELQDRANFVGENNAALLFVQERQDSAYFAGSATYVVVLAATENQDSAQFHSNYLRATEAQDTARFHSNYLRATEAKDTAAFEARTITVDLAATESQDTAAFVGFNQIVQAIGGQRSISRHPDPAIVEVDAWTGSSIETLRYSTHSLTTSHGDNPANTFYSGRIKDAGKIERLLFEQGATSGQATVNYGFVELINSDGVLDPLFGYGFDARAVRIKLLPTRDSLVATASTVFTGTLAGIDSTDALHTIRLRLRDRLAELDKPFLTTRYAGTTLSTGQGAEGDEQLAGQIKPYAYGTNINVPAKLVNRFDLFYQFAANAQTSIVVYDGGAALTNAGDFPALSSLLAAPISGGQYLTCLSQGIVRLGATPAFAVTADLVEGSALTDRSASRIAQRVLEQFGLTSADLDTDSFDDLLTFNPAEIGIYITDESTCLNVVSQILDSIGGVICPTVEDGVYQVLAIDEPSDTIDDTFTLRDWVDEGTQTSLFTGPASDGQGVPAWSVIVNYGKVWQVQTVTELAGSVDLARRTLLANDTRQVTAQDATIKTAHPLAVELTFDTLFANAADAQAEATRRFNLYSVRRDRLTFPTFRHRGAIDLGRSVKLQMNRFGYSAGRNFLVIGRQDDFFRNLITLTLWG